MAAMEELRAQALYAVRYRLRMIDDEFMRKVFEGHDECVELVLQIVLGKPDLKLLSCQIEYTIASLQGQEIRLDIRAVFDDKIVNVEVQRAEQGAGVRRARRNSSYMDASQENIGRYGEKLADTYVIFITENDKFKLGLPMYHIERCILENNQRINDGAHIIYVNGEYRGDDAVGKLMHDFFCTRAADMNYPLLAERVRHFKESEEGMNAMCRIVEELMNKSRDIGITEGRREGRREGRCEGRREGINTVNALNTILIQAGRFDDLKRAAENPEYQAQLIRELVPSA